jgi:ankyrin repeat protein
MTVRPRVPTRTLRARPDLVQLKRQAKELLEKFVDGDPAAIAEVNSHFQGARAESFALHDAQLVLARAYGFPSWPKLSAYVDGVTVQRFVDAARRGDLAIVRRMTTIRPELVHLDVGENDEHQALHHAVIGRHPDVVRFLMQHGANARKGIYPQRDATSALTLAIERGYAEIEAIIREEEGRRSSPPAADGETGLDVIGRERDLAVPDATQTAKGAVASGDVEWLRARHAEGRLLNQTGLAGQAIAANRPDVLEVLLELGYDPDEAGHVAGLEETVPTWGAPLRSAAIRGDLEMVRMLLTHGANPNTNVYAASCALSEAHQRGHHDIVAELERHGGRLSPLFVADLGLVDHVTTLLDEDPEVLQRGGFIPPDGSIQSELLWGAIGRPSPEIVELTLARTDWPRNDRRWFRILENGLYGPANDRAERVRAFALVLERADPNVRGSWDATLLHHIAASRGGLDAADRLAFATLVLDAGGRLDMRDAVLKSTPLGWACRWGRSELVALFLERGADPVELDAEDWARPEAWAKTRGHRAILAKLRGA